MQQRLKKSIKIKRLELAFCAKVSLIMAEDLVVLDVRGVFIY